MQFNKSFTLTDDVLIGFSGSLASLGNFPANEIAKVTASALCDIALSLRRITSRSNR